MLYLQKNKTYFEWKITTRKINECALTPSCDVEHCERAWWFEGFDYEVTKVHAFQHHPGEVSSPAVPH